MTDDPYSPPAKQRPPNSAGPSKPSWLIRVLIRVLVGGLLGLILGLSSRPSYSAYPGSVLNAQLRRDSLVYGGGGFMIGAGIGAAMYIARIIQDSKNQRAGKANQQQRK